MAISQPKDRNRTGMSFTMPTSQAQAYQVSSKGALSAMSPLRAVTYGLPAVALAMADTFAESLSFGLVGEDDMENYVAKNFGDFGKFFNENRGTVGAVGDVIGAFIPAGLAVKGIRATSLLGGLAEKHLGKNAAKFFTSTGQSNQQLFAAQFERAKALGTVEGMSNLDTVSGFISTNRKLIGRSMADTMIEGIAADLAIAGTMSSSDFLFPDEMTFVDNMVMLGGFNTGFALAGGMIARRTLKRGIDKAFGAGVQSKETIAKALSRTVPQNVAGMHGPALATHAKWLNDVKAAFSEAQATNNSEAQTAANNTIQALNVRIKEITEGAFLDSPIPGITQAIKIDDKLDSSKLNTVRAVLEKDPMMPLGLASFETFQYPKLQEMNSALFLKTANTKDELTRKQLQLDKVTKRLDKNKNNPDASRAKDKLTIKVDELQKEIDNISNKVALVLEVDGSISGSSNRIRMFQDGARHIEKGKSLREFSYGKSSFIADSTGNIIQRDVEKKLDISKLMDAPLDSDTSLTQDQFAKLLPEQQTGIFDILQSQIERLDETGLKNWEGMQVGDRSPFWKKLFAIEIIRKFDKAGADKITGPMTLENLQLSALNGQWQMFRKLRTEAATNPKSPWRNLDNVARATNLPLDDSILTMFEALHAVSGDAKSLPFKNMAEVEGGLRDHLQIPAGTPLAGQQWQGNMLNLPRDRQPVIALMENTVDRAAVGPNELAAMTASLRAKQLGELTSDPNSKVVGSLASHILSMPDLIKAIKDDLPLVVEGNRSQSAFLDVGVSQAWRYREDNAFRDANMVNREISPAVETIMKSQILQTKFKGSTVVADTYEKAFQNLESRGAEAELNMSLVMKHAKGAGWDVPKNPWVAQPGPNGTTLWAMQLATDAKGNLTERNKQIWSAMFGEEAPPKALMPLTGKKTTAVVTDKGRDGLQAENELVLQLHTEDAVIRRSKGLRELPKQEFHLLPPTMTHKHRMPLMDGAGNVRTVVTGNTPRELSEKVEKELAAATKNGRTLYKVPESAVKQNLEARGFEIYQMSDYTKPSNQDGAAKGTSYGGVVDIGAERFHENREALLRSYHDLARETVATVFGPEIQYMKLKKAASGSEKRTVYDDWISTLLGSQAIDTTSFVGKTLLTAESLYDNNLKMAWDRLVTGVKDVSPGFAGASGAVQREFEKINEKVGVNFNPWKSLEDYMATTNKTAMPSSLRKHASVLAEVTTATTLRIMDAGMLAVNFMSLASTLPPVIASLAKLADETLEDYQKRVGAFASFTPDGDGYFSPVKALVSATHFMFSEEGRAVAARAAKRGRFEQKAAEDIAIFGSTGEGSVAGFLRWATNKTSIATDWSERKSRQMAFMSFYNIGKKGMGLTDDAAEVFAHQQASNVIADFRPSNKPMIFQGAAGMPLGLFTTYMWNYLQRVATIVETLPAASTKIGGVPFSKQAFIQTGLQASLFGAESLPGWDKFTEAFMSNYDGSSNVVDRMNEAFGHGVTDVFLNGTIANVPKLFGAETGISVGPRASAGIPFEFGFTPPGIRLLEKTAMVIGKSIDSVKQERGINATQLAEIMAVSNVNKFMSNAIELATGNALDYQGNIIEDNTRTMMGIGARIVGFKPLMADELRQENVRNRTTDRIRTELKTRLADNLQSKIRHGSLASKDVEEALESYVRAGGNAESFKRYFQQQVIAGTTRKADLEIAEALRNSMDTGRIGRLLYLSQD